MGNTYKQQLDSPLWREKRKRILERDNYECVLCGKSNCELNVHHVNYLSNRLAWEYSDNMLVTLCKDCHNELHNKINSRKLGEYKIGDCYYYSHIDFDNYGFIYDIDFVRNNIYFASIDNGSTYDTFWIERFKMNYFIKKVNKYEIVKDDYWANLMVENIQNIIEDNNKSYLEIVDKYGYDNDIKICLNDLLKHDNDITKYMKDNEI